MFFYVGFTLAERVLYMPSMGFIIIAVILLAKLGAHGCVAFALVLLIMIPEPRWAAAVKVTVFVILALYTAKTIVCVAPMVMQQ